MADTRIEFNSDGFRQILLSEGCHELVQETADSIAEKANANAGADGFKASTQVGGYGGGRWVGFVSATDKETMAAESENAALTRALS